MHHLFTSSQYYEAYLLQFFSTLVHIFVHLSFIHELISIHPSTFAHLLTNSSCIYPNLARKCISTIKYIRNIKTVPFIFILYLYS